MSNPILTAAMINKIDHCSSKFPVDQKRSALLMALRVVQDEYGWLSEQAIDAVADHLSLPRIYAYEVVEFYSLYRRKKPGKHVIKVCNSISCYLCASQDLIHLCEKKLGIKLGETTPCGRFTLEETECIAACAGAPAILVNDAVYHEEVTATKLDQILHGLTTNEVPND
ncbi:MAG: NAD(P)H-dependent oxidoreductase subunit E [Legionellales bacterium]|nr:NAD(P)H-dependent oxidoreductase subunit E [Legionellales bacterium]